MNLLSPRRVVHVQLSAPLQPLLVGEDGRGLYVVFWLDDLPLGHEYFDVGELPISPRDLAAVASDCVTAAVASHLLPDRYPMVQPPEGWSSSGPHDRSDLLASIRRPLDELRSRRARSVERGSPLVSVVVATRENVAGLTPCLRSIQQLTPPPHEVVILDLTADGGRARAAARSFGYPLHRPALAREPNAAPAGWLPRVKGDIVAFTDDRSTAHPAWLEALWAAFHDPRVTAVTGLVLPAALDTEAQVAFERLLGGAHVGFEPLTYDSGSVSSGWCVCPPRLGSSANLAVRAAWLSEMAFDGGAPSEPTLERAARWDLWWQVLACGGKGRYEPSAVVLRDHPRAPHQIETEAFRSPCDLAAAAQPVDHGLAGARQPRIATGGHLLMTAARDIVLASRLQRRLSCAGVAGYLSRLGTRVVRRGGLWPARNRAPTSSLSTTK